MTSESLALAIVTAGTGAAAVVDFRTRRVPNALTASLAAIGILIAAAGFGTVSVTAALGGALLGLILMLPGYLFGGTGGGDVKLLAAVGTLLGPSATLAAFLFTTIAGGVIAVGVAVSRRRVRHTIGAAARLVATGGATAEEIESAGTNNRFAYAPAIAVGAVLALVSL